MSQREASTFVPPSVVALRNHGPLTLREITRWTAIYTNTSQFYPNVEAALMRMEREGLVMRVDAPVDYREQMWRAV